MFEGRAPKERRIYTIPDPFNELVTPYNFSDFDGSVKMFCEQNKDRPNLRIGKTIFLGDIGVGKTSIISRFREGMFDYNGTATVGVDIHLEGFDILGLPFNLQIWDTAGQERFKCISAPYFRGTSVVVVVFDFSNVNTLPKCEQWLNLALGEHTSVLDPYVLIVGNKLDSILPHLYEGIFHLVSAFSQHWKAEYWAVSSKTGRNINKLFNRIASLAFQHVVLKEINFQDGQKSCMSLIPCKAVWSNIKSLALAGE